MTTIKISKISYDGSTQSRVAINESVVADYAEAMTAGTVLPPVTLFFDGSDYWLADGFHRYHAHKKIGALEIDADVRNGTKRDAVLFSVGANGTHGLQRTNADKRRAVETLLADDEWSQWSDREIARQCSVGNQLVGDVRRAICVNHTDAPIARKVERNGKTYEQNTAKIGKREAPVAKPAVADQPVQVIPESEYGDDDGPSKSEIALFEEMEKAKQSAFDSVASLAESDDSLADALARIGELEEENARLRAELRVVKGARDEHMSAKNEAIRMVKSLQRKLAQAEQESA